VPSHPAVTHIPNRNLGGTGDFMRGLLALIDGGRHAHAQFMHADASCGANRSRAPSLLRHGDRPRLAVAGALLRELAPRHLFEKGARFDGKFGAKHGLLTAYLDARYHLVHALLRPRRAVSRILGVGTRLFV
jgi:hypothetical protein